jgi:hypothetical protein
MDFYQALAHWENLKAQLQAIKEQEASFRLGLFNGAFPNPTEGTNEYNLPDGRIIKGVHKLNRSLDEDKLPKVLKKLKMARKDAPIKTSVSLDLSAYRDLDDEDRVIFDECLEIKPGLPTLEIVASAQATPVAPVATQQTNTGFVPQEQPAQQYAGYPQGNADLSKPPWEQ